MIKIKNKNEIDLMSKACGIVRDTLFLLEEHIAPGVKTESLDLIAEDYILSQGAKLGFKGMYGYPATICISVEDEVVHGLPSEKKLHEGQIVSIDVGSIYKGFYGDHAKSFPVGEVSKEKKKLLKVTKECLKKGISNAVSGNTIGDISSSVQSWAESNGYGVVRELVGHGIGVNLHEEPQIPNYGNSGSGPIIQPGMCFAIEPMVNMGTEDVYTKSDGWTICTKDGMPSAHFEHTIAVTEKGPVILTQ
ncbi:MAG: type I methionyl aminopeptidase [Candidatus Marinimicrobia bacterium]|nr:type I methionyl aminopeptidase [Candidatus Neomarinimicrobiota bacterium]|tara:strand:- start:1605 stop:2348 length:744 start_codon:yes stop_codon:yes gene_type:complete